MARFEHLPIWTTATQLALQLEQAVARSPPDHKYPRGAELLRTAQSGLGAVMRAARANEQRASELESLVLLVQQRKTQLALVPEIRSITQRPRPLSR